MPSLLQYSQQGASIRCQVWLETSRLDENQPRKRKAQVQIYLGKMNVFKSAGPDEIYPQVFKKLAEVIAEALVVFSENTYKSDVVPQD